MDTFNQFIEQLLQEKGLPELDEAVHQQLVSDLSERLIDFINRRLLEAMNDADVNEFITVLDEQPANPAKVEEFVTNKVPNKQQITTDAMVEFRALYLGAAA